MKIIVHIPATVMEARPEKHFALPMGDRWLDKKAFRGLLNQRGVLIPTGILMYEDISQGNL